MAPYPSYLDGGPSRRPSIAGRLVTPLFVAAILATNYWVFVHDSKPEAAEPAPFNVLDAPTEESPGEAPQPAVEPKPERPPLDRIPARVVKGTIRRGEILSRVLSSAGIPPDRFKPPLTQLEEHFDFRRSQVGDKFRVELNQAGQVLSLRYERSPIEAYEAQIKDDAKTYAGRRVDVPIRKEEMRIGCAVAGTLYDSLVRCVEDPSLAAKIIHLLSFDLSFYQDVRDGDQVRFLLTREFVRGRFLRYGPVQALEYRGKFGQVRAYHFEDGEPGGDYYKEDATSVKRNILKSPLQYTRVSSGYQKRRLHPTLHRFRKHLAIDYAAPVGTPVWTVAEGKVVFRKRRGASGNLVVVRHADGYKTYYAHLHRFASGLKVGETVKQGEIIGYVGSTGRATGPHLHFAMKKNGKTINPLTITGAPAKILPAELKPSFEEMVAERRQALSSIEVLSPSRRRL